MVPGKVKLDSATYVAIIMEPHLVPFWQQCCEEYGWVKVVGDEHRSTKGYAVRYRDIYGLDSVQWPAQSPDLNLIEVLWMDMETELGETWGPRRSGRYRVFGSLLESSLGVYTPERLDR